MIYNTKEKTLLGMATTPKGVAMMDIVVRFTSDQLGETLSLSGFDDNVMYTIPFEAVEELVSKTRKKARQ